MQWASLWHFHSCIYFYITYYPPNPLSFLLPCLFMYTTMIFTSIIYMKTSKRYLQIMSTSSVTTSVQKIPPFPSNHQLSMHREWWGLLISCLLTTVNCQWNWESGSFEPLQPQWQDADKPNLWSTFIINEDSRSSTVSLKLVNIYNIFAIIIENTKGGRMVWRKEKKVCNQNQGVYIP